MYLLLLRNVASILWDEINTEHHQNCRRKRIPFIKSVQCYLFSNQQTHDRATIFHIMHACFPAIRKKEEKKHETPKARTMKRWNLLFSTLYFFCVPWDASKCGRFRFTPSPLHPIIMVFSGNIKNSNNDDDVNIQCIQTLSDIQKRSMRKIYITII